MIQQDEIRNRLQGYLRGDVALDSFNEWLLISSWDLDEDSNLEVRKLVGDILLEVHEYSSDHLSEAELKKGLGGLVNHIVFAVEVRDDFVVPRRAWSASSIATLLWAPEIRLQL